jgi:hypothetical protein
VQLLTLLALCHRQSLDYREPDLSNARMSLDDFNNRYLISRALGEGTYGKVKLGRDLLTQTDVRGAYPPSVADVFLFPI